MSEMVEKIAKAIVGPEADRIGTFTQKPLWCLEVEAAQRVLEALRGPVNSIRRALANDRFRTSVSGDDLWRSVIDRALSE